MLLWTAAIGSEIDRLGQEASTMRELRTKLLGVGSPVMEEVLAAFLIVVHGPAASVRTDKCWR